MIKRKVSEPLLALLVQTGITPAAVDAALTHQIARWAQALLRQSHPYVRRVRTTGVHVVGIARKYRRLLVSIEQRGRNNELLWHYHEYSPRQCFFRCVGTVPETAVAALAGRPLGDLIQTFPALSMGIIDTAQSTHDGWLDLTLTPSWQIF